MKIYSRKWIEFRFFPDWIQLILTIWVLHGLIFLPDQVIPETVPCDSFSVLFRRCSISASSSYDRHRCSNMRPNSIYLCRRAPFLFATQILSIGTDQSQSIQASIVSCSLPRHGSQPVTLFPLFEVTDPTCQSPLSSCALSYTHAGTVSLIWPQKLELIVLLNAFCKPS